jgi:AcrR family transcriptional regulator
LVIENDNRIARRSSGKPGRPRNPIVDQAILRAALGLFIEHGTGGASIEKIAKRAGVAKTSIYRRWASREALLAQAIETARNATGLTIELIDRTPPEEFVKLLASASELLAAPEIRKMLTRLIGSIPDWPRLLEVYRETYLMPRRLAFIRALERVRAAGLLSQHADPETLADMLIGAVIYRLLLDSPADNSPDQLRDHMVRLLHEAGFDVSELGR